MKRFFSLFIALAIMAFVAGPALAVKPVKEGTCATIQSGTLKDSAGNPITTGYDQWGYNYQANMFNGWYDNFSRPTEVATGGDRLIMKWNDGWLSNKDCDNNNLLDRHYGFTSYIGSGAWLTNHQSGTYESEKWNVVGTWKWLVLGTYEHDLVITSQDSEGNFTANGGYPAGSFPYTSPGQTPELITNGKVIGNQITFTTTYAGPYNPGYSATVTGTINSDGTIIGTSPVEWHSTLGTAVKDNCDWTYFTKIVAAPADATKADGFWYTADGVEIGPVLWGEFATVQEIYNDSCTGEHGVYYKSPIGPGFGHIK